MPIIPCNKALKQCLPCDDDPIRNISAEDPDTDRFIGIFNWIWDDKPPLNDTWQTDGCKNVCYSTISQEDADDCARRQAQECLQFFPPGSPVPVRLAFNTAQSYTVHCPDGSDFTWTVPAGEFVAINQLEADQIALSFAKNRAIQHRICILSSTFGSCINQSATLTIQAVGGTALFFPFHLGPQTPLGFLDCQSGFQPVHYIWTIISGSLPNGMHLDECTGIISGIPTVMGNFTFTVRATDSIGSYQQKSISICVVRINNSDPLPDGRVGDIYLVNLTESPGQQETELWTIANGSLPAGMTLSTAGVLGGIPTETGDFTIGIRVSVTTC